MAGRPRKNAQLKKPKYAIICTNANRQTYYLRDTNGVKTFNTYNSAQEYLIQHPYIPYCVHLSIGCIYV